ncbi:MAG TPA: response regulator [Chitinophagaceae bacterium]|jgi:DNA-binding response OmpR family regulator|nr:response regulator [Chitinophagaceae bacterium]
MKEGIIALLVDDDEDWLKLLKASLKANGIASESSVNGMDLWEKILAVQPDILLLDLAMKGEKDGEKFCLALKANHETAGIPIILLSSNVNIRTIAEDCGADSYLPKSSPVSFIKKEIDLLLNAA